MPDLVIVERPDDATAVVTLNRPDKRNALSIALRDEGAEALDALAGEAGLKCVVVTGAGDAFSAGFDLTEFEAAAADPDLERRLWESSDRWHRRWLEFPVVTVAAVNGVALAGGFDLAVMCDLRVVAATAWFSHPEVSFGDVVYGPLHDIVGGSVARDLVLTGRTIDAAEALRVGLANRVVAPERVREEALAVAALVAQAPIGVLRRTKAKIRRRAGIEPGATLDL